MYAYIKGILAAKESESIIVEAGGIGYSIAAPLSTIEALGQTGQEVKVHTYLYVREDAMNLYGFATNEELGMFKLLLTVSGVGPKAALSLLSAISPSKFSLAVISNDPKTLTRAQGIGTKIAQRIILELKDKISKEQVEQSKDNGFLEEINTTGRSRLSEAVSALMVLGYSAVEANKAIAAVYSDDLDLETIIRNALKGLAR